ncbi:MAG TPA: serine/threonine-protein kinase [Polyangiaceae bacterium]|nr:serine/threonine-protein kinase [Polyangiaceae bacterium]
MSRQLSNLPNQVGRYQVIRELGRGAMGQVLLAHDPVLDRPVAVKHLRDDLSLTGEQFTALTKRMEQEARAAARVAHPNLVALHDMGRDPIVGLFLVFEYIEGETLEERLKRGPLSADDAARLSRELGSALSEAHAAQILHRDIKPENVMLARTGSKLADFGIARLPDSSLTHPGGLLGTPAYSAPEALDDGRFSPASDQFSMACTLYEAISAQRAFPGDDAIEVAGLVQATDPEPLARALRLDPSVDGVLSRALSKPPAARYASCGEFGDALAQALSIRSRAAMITQPDGFHRALDDAPRRRSGGGVVGVVLLGVALLGGLALVYQSGWRVNVARGAFTPSLRASAAEVAALTPVAVVYEPPARDTLSLQPVALDAPGVGSAPEAARAALAAEPASTAADSADAGAGLP